MIALSAGESREVCAGVDVDVPMSPRQLLRERLRAEHQSLMALKAKVDEIRGRLPEQYSATDFSKIAKAYTLEAMAVLREALEAPSWSTRIEAAKTILAYAWGKPREMPEPQAAERPLSKMSTEELTITLKRTLSLVEAKEEIVDVQEVVRNGDAETQDVDGQGDAPAAG